MTRNTEKMLSAIRLLGIDPTEANLPAAVYYGRVVEQGWKWNSQDQQWEQTRKRFEVELEIRISSYNPDDVICTSDKLSDEYHKAGHLVYLRPPVQRENGLWQAYLRVRE